LSLTFCDPWRLDRSSQLNNLFKTRETQVYISLFSQDKTKFIPSLQFSKYKDLLNVSKMACRLSFLSLFMVVVFSFCLSGVQSVSFDDIFDKDAKKCKLSFIPGFEKYCEDDDAVSVSVDEGHRTFLRA